MRKKQDTSKFFQTVLTKHKDLLEYVYDMPIQDVIRAVLAEKVADVSVEKQQAFEEGKNYE